MPIEHPDQALKALMASLADSTHAIDRTFAEVGEKLGQGLTIFETLRDRLSAMSDELVGPDMARTRETLGSMSGHLRFFVTDLPDQTRGLEAVAQHGQVVAQSFDRLDDHIRLISAVSRSARIEAAQVSRARQASDFFDEIGVLVDRAKQTIDACAQDHGRLAAMLASAIESERQFDATYGTTLGSLADRFEWTLTQIEHRQRKSVGLATDVARQSRGIIDAVEGAIIALQCGDSTRQRLEHALSALAAIPTLAEDGNPAGMTRRDQTSLRTVLLRLVAAQLQATADSMIQDVRAIERTLTMLAKEIAATAGGARLLHEGSDPNATSFIAVLQAELLQASELFGKCNQARSHVEGVTEALSTFVAQFTQSAASLAETVCDIVLIGLNSGLHAARLGSDGRGLAIIAHELKTVGDKIVADSGRLTPQFAQMQATMVGMKRQDQGGVGHLVGLNDTMRHSMSWMRESGATLYATFKDLITNSTEFAGAVTHAHRAFSAASLAGEAILDAAGAIGQEQMDDPATFSDSERAVIAQFINQHVWPSYTMAAERDIHLAVLEDLGFPNATGASQDTMLIEEAEFLFG